MSKSVEEVLNELPPQMIISDPKEMSVIEMYRMMNGDLLDFTLHNLACFSICESQENNNQQNTFEYKVTTNDTNNEPVSVKITVEILEKAIQAA